MKDGPDFLETLRFAITAIRLTPSLNQTSTTRAIAFTTKMTKERFGGVSNGVRYSAAKNSSEVPIKRGVSLYRPIEKRYSRYRSLGGRPKGLSPPGFDPKPMQPGQPIRYRDERRAPV
jgi:hypothetical protein